MAEPFARSWIAGEVGTADSLTPYCRFGDLFAYGCIGVAGAVVLRRWLMPAA
jgi:apolipoprotein N-acyltransferase